MSKIDMQELHSAYTSLEKNAKNIKISLDAAKGNSKAIVSSDNLSGKVKDSINDEMNNYSQPIIDGYTELLKGLKTELLTEIQYDRTQLQETSNKAVISTGAVNSLHKEINQYYNELPGEVKSANGVISSISGLVEGLETLKIDDASNAKSDIDSDISDLVGAMDACQNHSLDGKLDNLLNSNINALKAVNGTVNDPDPYKTDAAVFSNKHYKTSIESDESKLEKVERQHIKKLYPFIADSTAFKSEKDLDKIDNLLANAAFYEKPSKRKKSKIESLINKGIAWFKNDGTGGMLNGIKYSLKVGVGGTVAGINFLFKHQLKFALKGNNLVKIEKCMKKYGQSLNLKETLTGTKETFTDFSDHFTLNPEENSILSKSIRFGNKAVRSTGIIGALGVLIDGNSVFNTRIKKYGNLKASIDSAAHMAIDVGGAAVSAGVTSAYAGATLGGTAGSVAPGPGNAAGAVAGGFLGFVAGASTTILGHLTYDHLVGRHS